MTATPSIRVGTDLVSVAQLTRKIDTNPEFRHCFLSDREAVHPVSGGSNPEREAGYFAAKEAMVKALGEGLRIDLRDIEIRHDLKGRPKVVLRGRAQEVATALGVRSTDVSITHTEGLAMAVVALVVTS